MRGMTDKKSGIQIGEDRNGAPIVLSQEKMLSHVFIEGDTGSGKTEIMLAMAGQTITDGGGLVYLDGKGDWSVFARIYAAAAAVGRADDVFVLNLITGPQVHGCRFVSNTFNPFSKGSPDALAHMLVQMMDNEFTDAVMWKARAIAMFTGLFRALDWQRRRGIGEINAGTIRDHLSLRAIYDLAYDDRWANMPLPIRMTLRSYLTSLPGFQEEKGPRKQCQTTLDQHGFLDMIFTKVLGGLADVYGHIFCASHSEIDMEDIYLRRRILFVMVPGLEKSRSELEDLGKVIVSSLRGMIGTSLGSEIRGDWATVTNIPARRKTLPFAVIFDETGSSFSKGMNLMSAQARSLGCAVVHGTQPINPSGPRADEWKEQKSNCRTQITMRRAGIFDLDTAEERSADNRSMMMHQDFGRPVISVVSSVPWSISDIDHVGITQACPDPDAKSPLAGVPAFPSDGVKAAQAGFAVCKAYSFIERQAETPTERYVYL